MERPIREYFRSLATGNGCEVVFPWYPEFKDDSPEMWLIRQTRREPKGPAWIIYPIAFVLWTFLSFWQAIRSVRENGKKFRDISDISLSRQFDRMLCLAWFKNISPLDYKHCRLYQADFYKEAEHYISSFRLGTLTRKLNAGRPTERLDHKVEFYHTLKAEGFPVAEIIDVFHADGRREFNTSNEDLSKYLGQDFFIKPVNLYMGYNAVRWTYNTEEDLYVNSKGMVVPASEFWAHVENEARELAGDNPDKNARLVQPLIVNHPELAKLSRQCLNTLRINTMYFPDGHLEFHQTALHIGFGDEVTSVQNNVHAEIDLETGCLNRAINRFYPGQLLDEHPTTGERIAGMRVPFWEESLALVERVHMALPENPLIGWDVAVTPDGPVLMEANCNPAFGVLQFTRKEPITRSQFCRLYVDYMRKK